ncbi:DUF6471 domain-containing protein [Luteimonas sp. A534]
MTEVPAENDWNAEASRVLKSLLARHGWTYSELVRRLNAVGADESYASVANKMSRGTFSFAFYLQCIAAMGDSTLTVDVKPAGTPIGNSK